MRAAYILLTMILILSVITACGVKSGDTETSGIKNGDAPASESSAPADQYGRPLIASALPNDLNFNGETASVLVRDKSNTFDYSREFIAEQNGELMNDAVYLRNITVEEKLNVKFDFISTPYDPFGYNDKVIKSVMANDNIYNILPLNGYHGPKLAAEHYLYNILELPYISFDKPWWSQDFINEITLYDQLYMIVGDVSLSGIQLTHALFFNKNMLAEYMGGINLYDAVEKGQWTIDYFNNIIKGVYSDLNGDGIRDDTDFYAFGIPTASVPIDAFLASMGLSITEKGADGLPRMAYVNDRSVSAYTKIYNLLHNNTGTLAGHYTLESIELMRKKFVQSEIIFMIEGFSTTENMRQMDDVYGVLPLFKYDERQAGYYTNVADIYSVFGVPITCVNPDLMGAVLESLSETSYMITKPTYFEITLKQKYLFDNIDAKMYDIVLAGNKYNFGFVYSNLIDNVLHLWRGLLDKQQAEFVSAYEASAEKYDKLLQDLIDKFAEWKK